jgi:hypothetical protein
MPLNAEKFTFRSEFKLRVEPTQLLSDSKLVKMLLLSFNPPALLEKVTKRDYFQLMKKNNSITVQNARKMTMRRASNLKKFFKLSYFKKKLQKGNFRFEGGLRYFEWLDYSKKFYSSLQNLTMVFQFKNFSKEGDIKSKNYYFARIVQPEKMSDSEYEKFKHFSKTKSKASAFFDKFQAPADDDGDEKNSKNASMSKLLPFRLGLKKKSQCSDDGIGRESINSSGSME